MERRRKNNVGEERRKFSLEGREGRVVYRLERSKGSVGWKGEGRVV